jgi:hypothetical protein
LVPWFQRSSDARLAALAGLLLFCGNAWICRELFAVEYSRHLGSIEAAYISISEQILRHGADWNWWPLWYGGIPFENTYPPLLHLLVAATAWTGGIPAALSHHVVTAVMYCLGPVGLFLLAWRLSGSVAAAFSGAALFSLVSPSAFLIPAVRHSLESVLHARRLETLVLWGEGPHVTSIALIPLAILLFHLAWEKRRAWTFVAAAIGAALLPLTNWLGAFGLAAALGCYLLARHMECGWRLWLWAAAIGVYAYLLAGPWIPPSLLAAIRRNGQRIGGDFEMGAAQVLGGLLLVAALFALHRVLARWRMSWFLCFALYYSLVTGAVTLFAEWWDFYLLPQPQRYHTQMELALCLLASALLVAWPNLWRPAARKPAVIALVLFCVAQGVVYREYARSIIGGIDMTRTIEYRMAKWMDANLEGRRVMAPGSVGFWMNAFTDTPQIGGGFDQAVPNPIYPAMHYQVLSGQGAGDREAGIAILWLKTYGADAIGVTGPESPEFFKPFANPGKFEGALPELWREQDSVIYAVPRKNPALAHVIRREDLPARPPAGGLDVEPLNGYVRGIDDPYLPTARFTWLARDHARIEADLQPAHLISVQITHHAGWRASVNKEPRPLWRDHAGQIAIEPGCDGVCEIELRYGASREAAALAWLRALAVLGGAVWVTLDARRRRAA